VELIVEKKQLPSSKRGIKDKDIVPVQISYGEKQLGRLIRSLGGQWDSDAKLWYVPYGKIKGTELEKHIILDAVQKAVKSGTASKGSSLQMSNLIFGDLTPNDVFYPSRNENSL